MISLAACLNTALPDANNWQTRLAREWQHAVGELSRHMRLEKITGNQLIIGVYDSHWISELFMLASHIKQEINGFLGDNYVANIRFVLAKKTVAANKKYFAKDQPTSPIVVRMNSRHEQILSSIKDRQLHDALEKFFYASVR